MPPSWGSRGARGSTELDSPDFSAAGRPSLRLRPPPDTLLRPPAPHQVGALASVSQRSKNLLEAFNRSKAPEKSPEPVPQPRGTTPRVGGPFADATPVAKAVPPAGLHELRPGSAAGSGTAVSPRDRWRLIVLCAGIAVIFFFIGRVSVGSQGLGGTVGAAEPEAGSGRNQENAPVPAAAPKPAANQSPRAALTDTANQYTVLACTYKLSEEQRALAVAARAHLLGLGFPAEVFEHTPKKQLYLLVGAAPSSRDLDDVLGRVRAATSARGVREFTTATTVSIDKYVLR